MRNRHFTVVKKAEPLRTQEEISPPQSLSKKNSRQYLILFVVYCLGAFLGTYLLSATSMKDYLRLFMQNYLNPFLQGNPDKIEVLGKHFASQLFWLLSTAFWAYSAFGIPLLLGELFFRGILSGCAFCYAIQMKESIPFSHFIFSFLLYDIGRNAFFYLALYFAFQISVQIFNILITHRKVRIAYDFYLEKWLMAGCGSLLWCALCWGIARVFA